jgi:hypothetical protein
MTATADAGAAALSGCSLVNFAAYVIVKPFETTYNSATVQLVLMRDPSGTSPYSGDWSKDDSTRWSTSTKASVPFSVDPTSSADYEMGYFVVPLTKFAYDGTQSNRCLSYVQFGMNLPGYSNDRYDAEINTASTSGSGSTGSLVYEPALT